MKAPNCRICGSPHWGACPRRVERMSITSVRRPAELASPAPVVVDDGEGMTAPAGQCPYCDRRREANTVVQRKRRKGTVSEPEQSLPKSPELDPRGEC